ncbi:MAG: acyl-CoA dehydratase activase [Dehalococcoidia bacterium]|nr:acyl-CoA dehydratase activase [Dehalococcoidia bacterium]
MTAIGLDIGSLTTKVVVMDGEGVLSQLVVPSGDDTEAVARSAVRSALEKAGVTDEGAPVVVTGVGAKSQSLSAQQKAMTTCLARGARYLMPTVRMVIDIGAESSTVIKLNERGRLVDWANHDKCAAGTGLFLQAMAKLMQVPIEEFAKLSLGAKGRADISGTCAVFAESEVISHVHRVPPTPKPDIVAGIYFATVSRLLALCKRIGIEKEMAVVGGVALNTGLVKVLEGELGFKVIVPANPQTVAALGAAIIARESLETGRK